MEGIGIVEAVQEALEKNLMNFEEALSLKRQAAVREGLAIFQSGRPGLQTPRAVGQPGRAGAGRGAAHAAR